MNLNVNSWKEFYISDSQEHQGLFKIENCKCGCAGDLEDGNEINYIGAKKNNNGVMRRVISDPNLVSRGNGILFICDGEGSVGYTNYMDKDFIGSTTISIGYNENLNPINAMFIVTILDKEKFKYSYGRKYRAHIEEIQIKLPTTPEGAPDWDYMERYIKSLNHKPLSTANQGACVSHTLGVETWKEYAVSDIFDIYNGSGITKEEIEENPGTFVAVQSGEEDNGRIGMIDYDYCKSKGYTMSEDACLTVARSGSAGFVSFHPTGCVVGDSAKILKFKNCSVGNTYTYLFLRTVLMANKYKYMTLNIMLPYKKDKKEPDWIFMENYIKSLPYGDRI